MFLNTEIDFTDLYHMVTIRLVLYPWNVIFLQRWTTLQIVIKSHPLLPQRTQQMTKHELKVKMFTDYFSYKKKKNLEDTVFK